MAKKKKVEVEECRMTTDEFAVIAKVSRRTVCEYCMKIVAGQDHVLKFLKQAYGLVSVERASNKWLLTVRPISSKV